jgi:hypothetical protein
MADDGWRRTAAYLYILDIPNSCRAWEFMRRNDGYRDDHRVAVTSTSASRGPGATSSNELVHRWGLQFLARSRPQR